MKVYGKINLLLRIIDKRKDGYHNLQMINSKIDIYDDKGPIVLINPQIKKVVKIFFIIL